MLKAEDEDSGSPRSNQGATNDDMLPSRYALDYSPFPQLQDQKRKSGVLWADVRSDLLRKLFQKYLTIMKNLLQAVTKQKDER